MAPSALMQVYFSGSHKNTKARLDAAHRATFDRASFHPLLWNGKAHKVRWRIPAPEEVETAYGSHLAQPESAYALPVDLPEVERSQAMPGRRGPVYWLRFKSPATRMGDLAYAKVSEPENVNPPTIIIGRIHGPSIFIVSSTTAVPPSAPATYCPSAPMFHTLAR